MSYERDNVKKMQGYSAGEQPQSSDVIKLNTNENPYPPGPLVASALAAVCVDDLRRYPPPTALKLRRAVAALHKLDEEQVIITNGGDELLRLAIATFVSPQESIGVATPSYSLYEVLANAHGCAYETLDLADDWTPPDTIAEQLNARQVKMAFLVNPHAPSGTLLPVTRIREIALAFKGVLVLDEAYVNFIDPGLAYDSSQLLQECDNLLILRTFSKGYSLAGLRMAYGLGASSLISPMLYKTRDSYNTDYIAQQLAQAAIEDQAYAATTWQRVREDRQKLLRGLAALGFSCPSSQSNFLLATAPAGISARHIYEGLKEAGILVRYFDQPRLVDKVRITVGTPEENAALMDTLTALLKTLRENQDSL